MWKSTLTVSTAHSSTDIVLAISPHMAKLYGPSLREEAGFIKVIKSVATKNARILESRAGKHGPEIRRVVKEVKGGFDKVFDETKDVVEEFLRICQSMSSVLFCRSFLYSSTKDIRGGTGDQVLAATIPREVDHYVSAIVPLPFLSKNILLQTSGQQYHGA
jgi:hypothetical protein